MNRLTRYKFRENTPHRVIELSNLYSQASTIQYRRDFNIGRPEALIINTVGAYGPQTAAAISRMTAFDKALISRGIGSLQKKGFVHYEDDGADKRQKIVALSAEGEQAFKINQNASRERYECWMEEISEEEIDAFEKILNKLKMNAESRLRIENQHE